MELLHYGALGGWSAGAICAIVASTVLGAVFTGAPLWSITALAAAACWTFALPWWISVPVLLPLLVLTIVPLRRALLSDRLLRVLRDSGFLPAISDTEKAAIAAGTVWLDGELFSGRPSLQKLIGADYPDLDAEALRFVDGPVATVCRMTSDWQVHQQRDLPPEVWDYLKRERFFGMIIPKEYGGLGLTASANSAVVQKLASRSLPLAITVMVPNSLGPAELLVHYGTEAQKKRWLPALATGQEVPCFALTEPGAGSDAGAIQATGVVFRGEDGKLWLRLQWHKRYITLAAVATVLGLAFQLHDPENLLGKGPFPGITCGLVPTSTPGVVLGRRHDPMGVPFYNCPTSGRDVLVPLEDTIFGGAAGAGRGWQMLMECLAAGRGISLPATATGGAQMVARSVGAYAAVRQQFGLPIGRFEGIEEPLARIAGSTWLLEAMRRYVNGALDKGQQPAVVTAIAKYNTTELWRKIINDGMDVMGGAAISRGPRNLLANAYAGTPICITVEGANILTRTLMIFGQGAIRCHPYAYKQLDAIGRGDGRAFDAAFWPHLGHVARNGVRTLLLGLTRGWLTWTPSAGAAKRWWRRLNWASSEFALLADLAMGAYGGDLKRKEKITGRFADWFSWLFLCSAALRRFEAEGRRREDLPLLAWACEHAFARMQEAREGLYQNLSLPVLGRALALPGGLWARLTRFGGGPDDRIGQQAARTLLQPGGQRDRITGRIHVPTEAGEALGRLEHALQLCSDAEPVLKKLKDAVRGGRLPKARPEALLDQAVERGIVSESERKLVQAAETARAEAVAVDSFTLAEYLGAGATAAAASELAAH
ncbi:MAG: acyl-CoA dehydrogenase [Planctomycetes bacterium]|jgi:acyl-CoA dehydrogenase|nr:acyl-CoA dehydrogenase [Planctomycetota bacterium]